MFLPGVEKRADDHADRSTGPLVFEVAEVAEGRVSRRASIPENRGRLWHLGRGLRVADSSQVAGWSKGLFPHTSRDAGCLLSRVSCYRVVFISSRRSAPAAARSGPRSPRGSFQKAVASPRASPRGIHHRAIARVVFEDPVKAKTGHSLLLSEAASQPVSGSAGTLATKPGCRV